jgi:flagellar assembly factor FliW
MNATPVRPAATAGTAEPGHTVHHSARFGEVQIADDSVISFPEGLIGLGGSSYALLSTDPASPFMWLQSLDNPSIALPVTNPHRFFATFSVELSDGDAERLGLDQGDAADVLVTVTASSTPSEVTVNLKAPILVHDGRGYQVINQADGSVVKAPLFPQV